MKCGGEGPERTSCKETDAGFSCHSEYMLPKMEPATDPELCGKWSIRVPDRDGTMKWQHVDQFGEAPSGDPGVIYARVGDTWHGTALRRTFFGIVSDGFDDRRFEIVHYHTCGDLFNPGQDFRDPAAPQANNSWIESIRAFFAKLL